jgi:protein-disulfide isomerase
MTKTNKQRDAERRSAAAARVAQMQREQKAAERRRRAIGVTAAVIAVVVVVVGIALIVANRSSAPPTASGAVNGASGSYGFVVGSGNAPAKVVLYEDFQCPHCQALEKVDGPMLDSLIKKGTLSVEYRPVAFLDEYSTRASSAAACVMNGSGSAALKKFHDLLYANQPPEGGGGLPNSQLIAYAKQAGAAGSDVASCISNETYKDWAANATEAWSKAGFNTTPTVLLDGKPVQPTVYAFPNKFKSAIERAAQSKS